MKTKTLETLNGISNDGQKTIDTGKPYTVNVTIRGVAPILFHSWSVESVKAKGEAKKGSEAKKTDDIESYVYRDASGFICMPGTYILGSMTDKKNGAAKYRQDPRSPRKSALDLYKAGVVSLTNLAPVLPASTGKPTKDWDYLDRRRVVIQQNAITRTRPAFLEGWTATFQLLCITPEYISPADLHACLNDAGRLVGVADFRPSFGRYQIDSFDIGLED